MLTSPEPDSWERPRIPSVSALAAEIAALEGGLGAVAERLLARHVTDALGYCRGCELPQAGPQRWPCTLWQAAKAALAALAARALPTGRPTSAGPPWERGELPSGTPARAAEGSSQ